MCGIVGMYSWGGAPAPNADLLRQMRDMLRHRGPDDHGEFIRGDVALGHRRLSIIDLATGHQPLGNEDGSVQIVFNGEIYNFQALQQEAEAAGHRFATRSDTETIVHLYEELGNEVVTRLGGMFAFGLWDGGRRRLLLARDTAGIKPLYYALAPGRLAFASEVRPLLALPWVSRTVDPVSLDHYLERGYVPAPRTMFRDVAKLPAGHRLWVEDGQVRIEEYQAIGSSMAIGAGEQELRDQLLAELDRSVREHLVSDVPVGAFLSGGLDSSTVVALMRRHCTGPLKTFSVAVKGGDGFDEAPYARQVARHFATEHAEIPFTVDEIPSLLVGVARFLDEPIADPAALPTYVVAKLAARSVKVVLTGEGADETWGGYEDGFRKARVVAGYRRLPGWLRTHATDRLLGAVPTGALLVEASRDPGYAAQLVHVDASLRQSLLTPAARQAIGAGRDAEAPSGWVLDAADPFGSMTRDLIATHLAERLLLKVDRMTMAHSLEARVPFLDRRVIGFALAVPSRYKMRRGTTKVLLRAAAAELLPEEIRARPKRGFNLPCAAWLRTNLVDFADELFARTALPELVDGGAVQRLWSDHREGRQDRSTQLWNLMMLELWGRGFCDG